MPLRQRAWRAAGLGSSLDNDDPSVSAGSEGSRGALDVERGNPGASSSRGTPTATPLKHNSSYSFFQDTTSAVKKALKVELPLVLCMECLESGPEGSNEL